MNNVVRMPDGGATARKLRAEPPHLESVVVSFTPSKPPGERPPQHSLASRFDPRSRPFLLAIALSALLHAILIPLFVFRGTFQEVKPPPKIIVVELAALGSPKAPEVKPQPPAAPAPPPKPTPPPPPQHVAPAIQPPPEPTPPPPQPTPPEQVAPQPAPLAAEPEAVPILPPVRPEPKPAPPRPKVAAPPPPKPAPPPKVTAPPPKVTPPPQPAPQPQPTQPPKAAAPQPAAPAAPAPATSTEQSKGIKTGVEGATSQAEMNRYVTTLFTMIDRKKVYPSQSMRRHEQGTVIVRLTIARDGSLVNVTSPTKSPERLVDASLDAVRDAAPFPPLPKSLNQDKAVFEVPVTYKLE